MIKWRREAVSYTHLDDEVKRAVMEFKAQNAEGSKFEHYYEIPLEDWFLLLRLFFLDNPDLSDMRCV